MVLLEMDRTKAKRVASGPRSGRMILAPALLLGTVLVAGCAPLVTIEGRIVDEDGAPLETCRAWHVEVGYDGYEYEYEVFSAPGRLSDDMLPPIEDGRFHYKVDCGFAYRVRETREVTGSEIYDSDYKIDLGEIVIEHAE